MSEGAREQGRWRPLLLAMLIAGAAWLVFFAGYLGADLLLNPDRGHGLLSLCQWDCTWYRSIAERGYDRVPEEGIGQLTANFGFFPGFPLTVGLLMKLVPLSFVWAAGLLNIAYGIAFGWLVLTHRQELLLRSEGEAIVFLLAFQLSPWSLFNHVPYSEMLFNLSLLGTFVSWRRGNWWAAGAFGFVLTATRVSGIVLPLILLGDLIWKERSRLLPLLLAPDGRVRALAAMPLGVGLFCVFLGFHIGDPLGYFHIQQAGWGQGLRDPLAVLLAGNVGWRNAYNLAGFVVLTVLIAAGFMQRRIPGPLALFAFLAPALVLGSQVLGLARYGLALFPVYLVVPALSRPAQVVIIAGFAVGQAVLVYFWLFGANWVI